jgi:hypothetical protein
MASCTGKKGQQEVDLINEIIEETKPDLRIMAVQESFLDTLGVNIEAGKRQDLFWIAIAVIVAGVLVSISIFGKKKRRKRS